MSTATKRKAPEPEPAEEVKQNEEHLAEAEEEQTFNSPEFGRGTFLAEAVVIPHPDYACCKKVEATFWWQRQITKSAGRKGKTKANNPNYDEVGEAVGYLIDRKAEGEDGDNLFVHELCTANNDDSEVVRIVKERYTRTGAVRKRKPAFFAKQLSADRIVHLDSFKFKPDGEAVVWEALLCRPSTRR